MYRFHSLTFGPQQCCINVYASVLQLSTAILISMRQTINESHRLLPSLKWTYLHEVQGSGGGSTVVTFRCIDIKSVMFILNQGASWAPVAFHVPLADLDLVSRRFCSLSWWWGTRRTGCEDGHPRTYTQTLKPSVTITANRQRRLTVSDLSMEPSITTMLSTCTSTYSC